jgi:hypothetical protein
LRSRFWPGQDRTLPFPDGTIRAGFGWKNVPLPGLDCLFVTGPAMVATRGNPGVTINLL